MVWEWFFDVGLKIMVKASTPGPRELMLVLLATAIFSILSPSSTAHPLKTCGFDRIYNVGDSLSDTGNLILESPYGVTSFFAKRPYGTTFFNSSTGRCSNGLLIIDYIAHSAGLPPLQSYKTMGINYETGVNFAVAGASALPSDILLEKRIVNPMTNSCLSTQMKWLMDHFNFTSLDETDLAEELSTALFLVGEIGGNDYNYGFFQGRTIPELRNIVPQVVGAITDAAQKLINIGAVKLIIPGDISIGCLPIYKTLLKSNSSDDYDNNQCLKHINNFAKFHNNQLQKGIQNLKRKNPKITIVYGDYYNAYQYLLQVAKERGYNMYQSCCGIGGEFNFDIDRQCGHPAAKVCNEPNRYISWDGTHLTQKSYGIMAKWLLHDIFPKLKCR